MWNSKVRLHWFVGIRIKQTNLLEAPNMIRFSSLNHCSVFFCIEFLFDTKIILGDVFVLVNVTRSIFKTSIHKVHSFLDEFVELIYVSLKIAFKLDSPLHEGNSMHTLRASKKFYENSLSNFWSNGNNILNDLTSKIITYLDFLF